MSREHATMLHYKYTYTVYLAESMCVTAVAEEKLGLNLSEPRGYLNSPTTVN